MSIKGIFGLFGFPDDDGESPYGKRDELNESLDVFRETPHFKIGMFCKMINNGKNFTTQIKKFLNTSSDPIDLNSDDWKLAIQEHKDRDIIKCLKGSIKYYESLEEYETCSFLKKIQDFASN